MVSFSQTERQCRRCLGLIFGEKVIKPAPARPNQPGLAAAREASRFAAPALLDGFTVSLEIHKLDWPNMRDRTWRDGSKLSNLMCLRSPMAGQALETPYHRQRSVGWL